MQAYFFVFKIVLEDFEEMSEVHWEVQRGGEIQSGSKMWNKAGEQVIKGSMWQAREDDST